MLKLSPLFISLCLPVCAFYSLNANQPILVADFQEKELTVLSAIPSSSLDYDSDFDDKATIMSMTEQLASAYKHADVDFLAKSISPDAIYITPFGALISQAQLLNDIRSGNLRFTEYDLLTIYVRSFNNTIVTIGNTHIAAQHGRNRINENFQFIRVFKRINGQWQVIATDLAIYKTKSP